MNKNEYNTGNIMGTNKGREDGVLLIEPYPYTEMMSEDFNNGYRIGYLNGYINSAKEKEKDADKEMLKLINNRYRAICDIVLRNVKEPELKNKNR